MLVFPHYAPKFSFFCVLSTRKVFFFAVEILDLLYFIQYMKSIPPLGPIPAGEWPSTRLGELNLLKLSMIKLRATDDILRYGLHKVQHKACNANDIGLWNFVLEIHCNYIRLSLLAFIPYLFLTT